MCFRTFYSGSITAIPRPWARAGCSWKSQLLAERRMYTHFVGLVVFPLCCPECCIYFCLLLLLWEKHYLWFTWKEEEPNFLDFPEFQDQCRGRRKDGFPWTFWRGWGLTAEWGNTATDFLISMIMDKSLSLRNLCCFLNLWWFRPRVFNEN